jgi:iron complex outermembrane receptor protein
MIIAAFLASAMAAAPEAAAEDVIVVTADRTGAPLAETPGALSVLSREDLLLVNPVAPAELLNRVPGVFVQAGSGREHLTAIRSPVLTGGAGAGSFLFLQDGVPLRAPGFANVNGLFDAQLPFAERIEVVRGPGDVAYGSNALHGAINVITPRPGEAAGEARFSAGSFDRYQGVLAGGNARWRGGLSILDDGGYRADQSALQIKGHGALALGDAVIRLSAHHLEQETGGFVQGPDAYRIDGLRRSNPDPEAFRDVRHILLSADIPFSAGGWEGTLTPYARAADMDFRLHFFPGDPLEENRHASVGLQSTAQRQASERVTLLGGLDLDITRGELSEFQEAPTVFSFTQGLHYDYRVDAIEAAPFLRAEFEATDRLVLRAGVRATATRYDYETDAEPGLVGRFRRPADRTDDFLAVTAKVSALYDLGPGSLYASLARGARPPQTTDLYRLQTNQTPDGIDPETLDAAELGWRVVGDRGSLALTGFAMKKRNVFFRDSDGFNVTDGETTHAGLEAEGNVRLTEKLTLRAAGTVAEHLYAFERLSRAEFGRELITEGNEVDTAPTTLATAQLVFTPLPSLTMEAAWTHVGAYFTDAANENEYPGHDLLDLRAEWRPSGNLSVLGIVRNVTDERYARRADFAFGSERYFPGEERAYELVVRREF